MSQFECPVVRVKIEPHPNADAIELAIVGGYRSIVKKGQFEDGYYLAVYIPESAVLPEWMLKRLGFWDDLNQKGTLTSSKGNRVKAIKLRGVLSQGLLYPLEYNPDQGWWCHYPEDPETRAVANLVTEGQDVSDILGIVKYEPPIPQYMSGRVAGYACNATIKYDFENIKKNPTLFDGCSEVIFTEKVHGTLLQVGLIPRNVWECEAWADKCPDVGMDFKGIVTSKGMGGNGLLLDPSDGTNLYANVVRELGLFQKMLGMVDLLGHPYDMPIFLFGEIFGAVQTEGGLKGIQDLTYGQTKATFNAFDLYAGDRNEGYYLAWDLFEWACNGTDVDVVPILYRGPYDKELVMLHTNGNTTIGGVNQIREGIVIKSVAGERHPHYGRRCAKSVSEAYLLRKNATELA